MKNYRKIWKKITFFYALFHIIAYLCFLISLNSSSVTFETDQVSQTTIRNFYFNPDYTLPLLEDIKIFDDESDYFYPFHEFHYNKYAAYVGNSTFGDGFQEHIYKGFIGVFGYYGHMEFIVYFILPILLYFLILFYRKYVNQ